MSLSAYKWLITGIIASMTLITGFFSLHYIRRYQNLLTLGDAFADGIFIGAAAFHLLPLAIHEFSITSAILATLAGFFLLFLLERSIIYRERKNHQGMTSNHLCLASTSMLVGILSIHALIAGAALGVSETISTASILLIAILAHKGFESFALAMRLHRNLKNGTRIQIILFAFSFVTPLGIILATFIESHIQVQTHLINGLFSAFAAGSFFYIGTLHGGHNHFHPPRDPTKRYDKVIATLAGIFLMGIVAIWV